jgi:CheY-like chemotaxis protein
MQVMTKRVLVCEDDGAIQLLLEKLLTRRGWSPECVTTGAEAVARLRREPYDLILLDLITPIMSGYEVVDILSRERPHLLGRVIVVTAVQRAFQQTLPVAAILRKPFDLDELDGAMNQILTRAPASDRNHHEQRRGEGELR